MPQGWRLHGPNYMGSFSPRLIQLLLSLNVGSRNWCYNLSLVPYIQETNRQLATGALCWTSSTLEGEVICPLRNWHLLWIWVCLHHLRYLCQHHSQKVEEMQIFWHRMPCSNNSLRVRKPFYSQESVRMGSWLWEPLTQPYTTSHWSSKSDQCSSHYWTI